MLAAIRGATTISLNNKQQIEQATLELYDQIIKQNKLILSTISYIHITTTADITAYYPATALRLCGADMPLFSSLEPPIEDSLPLCIRMLVLVNIRPPKHKSFRHIYLREAINLRRKAMKIAIDGSSATGKSTVSKMLSSLLNLSYLDTGAMYRAIALKAYDNNVFSIMGIDNQRLLKILPSTVLSITGQRIYLDGVDVSDRIREHYVSKLASDISAIKEVRLFLVELQRKIAGESGCILDGRDIGTYVLPDADFKFFLTAKLEERAKRRYNELIVRGQECELEQIKKDIAERDFNDSNRQMAPLKKADDAYEIDTTYINAQMVIQKIMDIINAGK